MVTDRIEIVSGSNEDNGQNSAATLPPDMLAVTPYMNLGENSAATLPPDMLAVTPYMNLGELEDYEFDEELLPGIPHDITMMVISPMLSSWRQFPVLSVLSAVSRGWERAIQSGLVDDIRVRTHPAETLALVAYIPSHSNRNLQKISLYSMRDGSWHELPPIPGEPFGLPCHCQCVALDGKIYVMGGRHRFEVNLRGPTRRSEVSKSVYVLDMLRQRQWTSCASMQDRRKDNSHVGSSSTVVDGKIYCFGGYSSHLGCARKCEVYDPERDVWSRINPMISTRVQHQVMRLGNEIFVQGGYVHEDPNGRPAYHDTGFPLVEAYNPVNDEWRVVPPLAGESFGAVFVAGGKIHVVTRVGIFVHDSDHSRALLQSCSFPAFEPLGSIRFLPTAAIHMDDELLLLVKWNNVHCRGRHGSWGTYLLRSTGFGQKDQEIVWERIVCPCRREHCGGCHTTSFMGTIQL